MLREEVGGEGPGVSAHQRYLTGTSPATSSPPADGNGVAHIDSVHCVGCGVCSLACPEGALVLVRREDVPEPPVDEAEWRRERARARGLDLDAVL